MPRPMPSPTPTPISARHGTAAALPPVSKAAGATCLVGDDLGSRGRPRRKEPSMLIRSLRAHITRLVLVGAMTASVAVGSVAIGPSYEAAAMPRECADWESAAEDYFDLGDYYKNLGYIQVAGEFYKLAFNLNRMYLNNCL